MLYFFAYFRKFAPELPVVLYHGSQAERQELRSKHLDEVHIIKVTNEPFPRHKHCIHTVVRISGNSFRGNYSFFKV